MIYLDRANIGEAEKQAVIECLESGAVSSAGHQTDWFEDRFRTYFFREGIATSSGTAALHLALIMAGVKPGDEVALPVTTFQATVNAVMYCGGVPRFVDVDADTFLANIGEMAQTCAPYALPVHLYGARFDVKALRRALHGATVIEDAAEALGVEGLFDADFTTFSFNGNKTITAGGGGFLTINNGFESLLQAQVLSQQAKSPDGRCHAVGYNYRMPALNAALACAQLGRLREFLHRKAQINELYRHELSHMMQFQEMNGGIPWLTVGLFKEDRVDVERLSKELLADGIQTRRVFRPLTDSRPFARFRTEAQKRLWAFPNARMIYDRGICLPSGTALTDADIHTVCKAIVGLT